MDPRGGELPPLPSASHKPVRATPQLSWVSGRSMREGGGGGDKFVRRRSVVARTPTLDPSPQGGGCRLVNEVVVKTSSPNHRAARGLDPRVWCRERNAVRRRVAHGSGPWAARWVGTRSGRWGSLLMDSAPSARHSGNALFLSSSPAPPASPAFPDFSPLLRPSYPPPNRLPATACN